jgi:hypothetical protein
VPDGPRGARAHVGARRRGRSRRRGEKKLIERAYTQGERLGLAVWCHDQAGPFQSVPYPGASWRPIGAPARHPHEYVRTGTAKLLTLFHPADGHLRATGVTSCTNAVLHPWLQDQLAAILADLPPAMALAPAENRAAWTAWQDGLLVRPTLSAELPPLRLLLVLDNLTGHKTPAFVLWLFAHGVMPLYTPLSGSWLNMAESIQRILERRALDGQHPETPAHIIAWLEAAARGWNAHPTPFIWDGARRERRRRARHRHRLGGSGACTEQPLPRSIGKNGHIRVK